MIFNNILLDSRFYIATTRVPSISLQTLSSTNAPSTWTLIATWYEKRFKLVLCVFSLFLLVIRQQMSSPRPLVHVPSLSVSPSLDWLIFTNLKLAGGY